MRRNDLLAALFTVSIVSACHMQTATKESFLTDDVVITGENSAILRATDRALAESQFITERRMMLQDGAISKKNVCESPGVSWQMRLLN